MRIAIMGSGGVGGFLGARLAAAGEDVTFIARGAHLAAMRDGGLKVFSQLGDVALPKVAATDDPATVGAVDAVAFSVKLYDMAAAAERIRPLVRPGTAVIPFVNGVDAPGVLAGALGAAAAAGGVIRISAAIEAPGTIRHNGAMCDVVVGALDPAHAAAVGAFDAALGRAGVTCRTSDDIATEMWRKMIFIAPFAAITAVTRRPCGTFKADPALFDLFRRAVAEAVAVARALGVKVADEMTEQTCAFVRNLPDGMTSSMHMDLGRGNRLELAWLSGALVRLGREAGVETPVHAFVAAVLGPWADGAPREA